MRIFSVGRTVSRLPTASLLCSFENVGYGRFVLDSEARAPAILASGSIVPGMDVVLWGREGEMDVLEVDLSFVDTLR